MINAQHCRRQYRPLGGGWDFFGDGDYFGASPVLFHAQVFPRAKPPPPCGFCNEGNGRTQSPRSCCIVFAYCSMVAKADVACTTACLTPTLLRRWTSRLLACERKLGRDRCRERHRVEAAVWYTHGKRCHDMYLYASYAFHARCSRFSLSPLSSGSLSRINCLHPGIPPHMETEAPS